MEDIAVPWFCSTMPCLALFCRGQSDATAF